MYNVIFKDNCAIIENIKNFELKETLDCGQAFRWKECDDGCWGGVVNGKYVKIRKDSDTITLIGTNEEDFNSIWCDYFDLDRDYSEIINSISGNEILKKASDFGKGIRVLNQEPWETLCSFIISQNNNIKRIKGIIDRLCENFGEDIGGYYTFPTAEKLAALTLDDLAVLRSGFRAKYILDAAKKVSSGEVSLDLKNIPVDDARKELMKITGVGPKVADCALLFSQKHIEAFPKDVWIKRAMQVLFDGELPEVALPFAGIVQQYIFFYARETKLNID